MKTPHRAQRRTEDGAAIKFFVVFTLIIFQFQPLNQLVTSGNANLYSNNAIEEGLHSALGIQADNSQPV